MPTTNPVPSSDPTDLLFNAQKLDEFVNGPELTFTDRLGNSRLTLRAIEDAAAVASAQFRLDLAPTSGTLYVNRGLVTDFTTANAVVRVRNRVGADVTGDWALNKVDTGVVSTLTGGALAIVGYDPAQVDPAYTGSVIRLPFDGSTVDASSQRVPLAATNGTVTLSGTGGPFTGAGYAQFGTSFVSGGNQLRYAFRPALIAGGRTSWSMSAWIYLTEYPTSSAYFPLFGPTGRGITLNRENFTGANTRHRFELSYVGRQPNTPSTGRALQVNSPFLDAAALALNTWYFVEGTWSHVDLKLRLFLDGVLLATSAAAASDVGCLIGHYQETSPGCGVMVVGGSTSANGPRFAGGRVADLDLSIGGTVNVATYTRPAALRAVASFLPSAQVTIEATDGVNVLTGAYSVNTIRSSTGIISVALSRQAGIVYADWQGAPTSYAQAHVTLKVLVDGVDDSANWDWVAESKGETNDITFTMSGKTLTITEMETGLDSAPIVMYLSHPEYSTQYLEYPVLMVRSAKPAQTSSITPLIALAGDLNGGVADLSAAICTGRMFEGGTDASATWSWSHTVSSGITVSRVNNVVTITAINAATDSGIITLTASKSGWTTTVLTCTVTKSKQLLPAGQVVRDLPKVAVFIAQSGTAIAQARFRPSGVVEVYSGGAWTTNGQWFSPTGGTPGDSFDIFLSGTWTALSSDVTFTASATGEGNSQTVSGTVLIASDADRSTVLGSGQLYLFASVASGA